MFLTIVSIHPYMDEEISLAFDWLFGYFEVLLVYFM